MVTVYKPILFSTAMVQAILAGQKTMTRRICKPLTLNYPVRAYPNETPEQWLARWNHKPPYKPGDILWVRETWCTHEDMADVFENQLRPGYYYKANEIGKEWVNDREIVKWRPSIFMPREAARIFLRVTDVRVERLQDITPKDAWDEGCRIGNSFPWEEHIPELQQQCKDILFIPLWDNLNAKRGYGWDTNPWVWVISFERCEKPEAL